jgi:hypothetical protein
LAPRDGEDRTLLDLPLQRVETRIGPDHRLGERRIAANKRRHRIGQHLLRDTAHLGDVGTQAVEIGIEALDGVVGHGWHGSSPVWRMIPRMGTVRGSILG